MQNEERPKSNGDSIRLRAAQYVRMSTDHQRYSTQNQEDAIAGYAAGHNLTIVRTYSDEGISGLRLDRRQALKDLISDVVLGRADFDLILVYDISRWGRFQDADESAHYEFICKEAGVRVEYCAEEFRNDGSFMSNIAKALKRGMAGEFSRELSVKVFAAHCRQVKLGFRQGGSPGLGLRRQLIDEHGNPKGLLKRGERKNLQADRVILQPGTPHEVELVRYIFHQFVVELKSRAQIVRELNQQGLMNHHGRPWRPCAIRNLLRNENYIGTNIYNRKVFRFQLKQRDNPPHLWIRAPGAFEAVVDPSLFARAQEIRRTRRHLFVPDGEMLTRLRSLLKEKGRLSCTLINEAEGVPHHTTYIARFGSLANAYKLIEYDPKAIIDDTDGGHSQALTTLKLATDIIAKVEGAGGYADFDESTDLVTINGGLTISINIARYRHAAGRGPLWTVRRRLNRPGDFVIALRTDQTGRKLVDFLLLPTANFPKTRMEFSDGRRSRIRLDACRFDTLDVLFQSIWQHCLITAGYNHSP